VSTRDQTRRAGFYEETVTWVAAPPKCSSFQTDPLSRLQKMLDSAVGLFLVIGQGGIAFAVADVIRQ
jgi:hypothetical protein